MCEGEGGGGGGGIWSNTPVVGAPGGLGGGGGGGLDHGCSIPVTASVQIFLTK